MIWARDTLFATLTFPRRHIHFGSIQVMLVLQVNGKPQEIPPGSNVENLIAVLQLNGKRFAIELNGEIVPKSRHAATRLNNGDRLEVVVAVGGG